MMSVLIGLGFSTGNAAEHRVGSREVIGTIAQKTGCSVEHLAELNNIDAPAYIVRQGEVLRYLSNDDFADAQAWVAARLEYNLFSKILKDIETRNIKYNGDKSTHADEVLLFAQLYRKQLKGN